MWQCLPQGYRNLSNTFQPVLMEVLVGLDATVYIDTVYIADDTEEEHPEKLQQKEMPA